MNSFLGNLDYDDVIANGPYQVPVGTILPYMADVPIPKNWRVWNGEYLHKVHFPELFAVYEPVWEFIEPIWREYGGERPLNTLLKLPNPTSEQVWQMMGYPGIGDVQVVVACKVRSDGQPS
jgi:hypothetical protein